MDSKDPAVRTGDGESVKEEMGQPPGQGRAKGQRIWVGTQGAPVVASDTLEKPGVPQAYRE